MRRLLSFGCEGAVLGATLDDSGGAAGLLLVTGGSQTRIGSHRMYESLSRSLVENGFSCFRFDRRGVGDSGGEDPGFRGSAPDLAAAAAAFRTKWPPLRRLYGFGLCDGATALALFADRIGLDGLILVNPWLVEAAANEPPPAAIRHHYRQRLLSLEGWRKILSGRVDYRKALRGLGKIARPQRSATLGQDVASALARHRLPTRLVLATGDATAIAAEQELRSPAFAGLIGGRQALDTDSHTFARPGDDILLRDAVLAALQDLEATSSDGG